MPSVPAVAAAAAVVAATAELASTSQARLHKTYTCTNKHTYVYTGMSRYVRMYATFTYIPKYINEETSCQAKPNLSIAKANFKNKIKLTITV